MGHLLFSVRGLLIFVSKRSWSYSIPFLGFAVSVKSGWRGSVISTCMKCCAGLNKRVLVILLRRLNVQSCRLGCSAAWKDWELQKHSTFNPRVRERVKLLICAEGMHSGFHKHGHQLGIYWWHFIDWLDNLITIWTMRAILDCVMHQSHTYFHKKENHRTF